VVDGTAGVVQRADDHARLIRAGGRDPQSGSAVGIRSRDPQSGSSWAVPGVARPVPDRDG
jgi:hypothetical protein